MPTDTTRTLAETICREMGLHAGPTAMPTEPVLPMSGFREICRSHNIPCSDWKLYRWLTLERESLPSPVQAILQHAPAQWYIVTTTSQGRYRGRQYVVPLRYLSELHRAFAIQQQLTKNLAEPESSAQQIANGILRRQPTITSHQLQRELHRRGHDLSRRHIYRIIARHSQQQGARHADHHDSYIPNPSP